MEDTSGLEKAEEGEEQRAAHPHANHFSTNGLNATYWGAGGASWQHCNAKQPREYK